MMLTTQGTLQGTVDASLEQVALGRSLTKEDGDEEGKDAKDRMAQATPLPDQPASDQAQRLRTLRHPMDWAASLIRVRPIEVVEVVGTVSLITALSIVIPNQWGFLHAQPHPLWLAAIGIGLRYGAPSGHLAALLSAFVYALLISLQPDRAHLPLLRELFPPFMMLAGGVAVTEISEGRVRRQNALEASLTSKNREVEHVVEQLSVMTVAKEELEERVLTQAQTVVTLSAVGKQLQKMNASDLHQSVLRVIADCLGVEASSLYIFSQDGLQLTAVFPNNDLPRSKTLDPASKMLDEVIQKGRVVTIRERLIGEGMEASKSEPFLMAGPLFKAEGVVSAVVLIERIPFQKLTPGAIQQFEMLLDWASAAYQNARLFEVMLAWGSVAYQDARLMQKRSAPRASAKSPTTSPNSVKPVPPSRKR